MKTGKLKWETKLIDSEKLTVGFTGAPLFVNGKVIIGSQGGEWPYRGPIFGVDAASGKQVWSFFTVGGNDDTETDAAQHLGRRFVEDRRRRRLDGRRLRREDQHALLGHRQPGAVVRLGRRGLEDEGRAAGRQPVHDLGARRWTPTPASSSRTTRSCRTTRGTSTARSASS